MPGQDRTGPNGEGPLTGRGLGPCGRGRNIGLGRGVGRGMGRGFRFRRFMPIEPQVTLRTNEQLTPAEEKEILQEEKEYINQEVKTLKEDLIEIERRLKRLNEKKE